MRITDEQWDAFVHQHPRAHVLQLSAWSKLKCAFGWQMERVTIADSGHIRAGAQLLFRPLPLRLATMAYLPMGPYMAGGETDTNLEAALWRAIDETAQKHRAAFLKWEPGIFQRDEPVPDFARLGFDPSPQAIQPPRTILVDIGADDETVLSRMNQGTRRKIRQGAKKGVRFYSGSRADLDRFNAMMQTTGARNEFGVHTLEYYERAYDLFVPQGDASLFMAEHEGDPLTGIMVFAAGQTAWYFYGASSNIKRNLMATYGAQWKAIQWARARGCQYYDLWGVPDEDEATLEAQFQARTDDLWGVYGFKRGWGGEVVRSVGAWDKVYNSLVYSAYRLALKVRR